MIGIYLLLFAAVMMASGICMTFSGQKMKRILRDLDGQGEIVSGTQKGLLFLRSYIAIMAVDQSGWVKNAKMLTMGFLYPGKVADIPVAGKNLLSLLTKQENMDANTAEAVRMAARQYSVRHKTV